MWPHELSNGKWLLYPTALHFHGHPETPCTPHTSLNPRKFSHSSPDDQPQAAGLKARRKGRSNPEEEGHVMTKGSLGRTTPAVAASERRKSLKLVRERVREGQKGGTERERERDVREREGQGKGDT
ncbi:unnamed protein product [Oncorhynchus mykiss]|uniref:Integrin alpha third immunoglobulin-like domain-containing protein n=1 Tax=Oncorhynchus mykiss TaxID=8022 RepID=A0A060Z8I7_ONCMY|nr:unnamed protein product [Oncorhynchus mykiss]